MVYFTQAQIDSANEQRGIITNLFTFLGESVLPFGGPLRDWGFTVGRGTTDPYEEDSPESPHAWVFAFTGEPQVAWVGGNYPPATPYYNSVQLTRTLVGEVVAGQGYKIEVHMERVGDGVIFTPYVDNVALAPAQMPLWPLPTLKEGFTRFYNRSDVDFSISELRIGSGGRGSSNLLFADFESVYVPPFNFTTPNRNIEAGRLRITTGFPSSSSGDLNL